MQRIDLRLLDVQMEQLSRAIAEKQRLESLLVRSDRSSNVGNNEGMTEITREEFNAKLETIEARMDARVESVSSKIDAFLTTQSAVQVERDKAQAERDKRFELLAERATKAAEGAEEAAKQAATVKSNYWAAVIVQLLAVVAILVGAYYANQANVFGAMQTTMSAFQAGKAEAPPPPSTAAPIK
ncbi:hypothetical protein [Pseudomonas kribbensis]|uniref:hypothetical protein n=1 Tax=Pseudomonas kribbensis TaxID=1628086 RepID=UPI001F1DC797|nr:hypothetical protein [Pseudomonas kribbensis]UIN53587.1 hypothetical protein LXN51_21885 [Pseudomonas kribbensis]